MPGTTDQSIDILICGLPAGVLQRAPAAPALLKGCVQQAGYTAATRDLALDLYINQCGRNLSSFSQINCLFEPMTQFDSSHALIQAWINDCATMIDSYQPRCLGLSVFSHFQHRATVLICNMVRQRFPEIKIILGGMGLDAGIEYSMLNFNNIAKIDLMNKFHMYITRHGLADKFIFGVNGESDLVTALDEIFSRHRDSTAVMEPRSDFDDYQFKEYLWHNEPLMTITSSKGCVRACTFCNIPSQFGRFSRRQGAAVAEEMISLRERYGVKKFEFTDSLVNGSQKDFLEMITRLAQYNYGLPDQEKIIWFGQYICRPQSQIKKSTYELMKQSGASTLLIGIESASNSVLDHMDKQITIQDVEAELEQLERHRITCTLLVMLGYVNETREDFFKTMEFLLRCHRYLAAGIANVSINPTLFINPGTPLYEQAEKFGITLDPFSRGFWTIESNPENTFLERMQRKLLAHDLLDLMGNQSSLGSEFYWPMLLEQIKNYEQRLIDPTTRPPVVVSDFPHD